MEGGWIFNLACFDGGDTLGDPCILLEVFDHKPGDYYWPNFSAWLKDAQKDHHLEMNDGYVGLPPDGHYWASYNRDISKTVSHALRHEPWIYELELDDQGWVEIDSLLAAMSTLRRDWRLLTQESLEQMIRVSEKPRHEVQGRKIRALYGHSIPNRLMFENAIPPKNLFHGTAPKTAETILKEGLKPMSRQYVHLSVDTDIK